LVLSLPFSSIETLGNLDIIIENEAGYGSFIADTSARYMSYSNPLSSDYINIIPLSSNPDIDDVIDPFDTFEQLLFNENNKSIVIPPQRIYGITVI
jgi:hypothetical protein